MGSAAAALLGLIGGGVLAIGAGRLIARRAATPAAEQASSEAWQAFKAARRREGRSTSR